MDPATELSSRPQNGPEPSWVGPPLRGRTLIGEVISRCPNTDIVQGSEADRRDQEDARQVQHVSGQQTSRPRSIVPRGYLPIPGLGLPRDLGQPSRPRRERQHQEQRPSTGLPGSGTSREAGPPPSASSQSPEMPSSSSAQSSSRSLRDRPGVNYRDGDLSDLDDEELDSDRLVTDKCCLPWLPNALCLHTMLLLTKI